MSGIEAVNETVNKAVNETASRGRVFNIVLLVLRVVVGLDFIIGGSMKLAGTPTMLDLFTRIGAGQWMRYLVGVVELTGGISVLIPVLSGFAAIGLATLLGLAIFTNVVVINDPPWVPLTWLVLCAIVAWHRLPRSRAWIASLRRRRVDAH